MITPTLLGHLARFSSFSTQAELLCTQGLTYLLDVYSEANSIMASEVEKHTGVRIDKGLQWVPEVRQEDDARPDIEGRDRNGISIVKVEAKLAADLTDSQIQSYEADLKKNNEGQTALLVLVPRDRTRCVATKTASALNLTGGGPWPAKDARQVGIAIIAWEELFSTLAEGNSPRLLCELEQLQAMYTELNGSTFAPIDINGGRWREQQDDYEKLVDVVTRQLSRESKLLPMIETALKDKQDSPNNANYKHRHICRMVQRKESCYAIGVRDPYAGFETPIWLRVHKNTGYFREMLQRLRAGHFEFVSSGGHIWIPMSVPLHTSSEDSIGALVEQAIKMEDCVY